MSNTPLFTRLKRFGKKQLYTCPRLVVNINVFGSVIPTPTKLFTGFNKTDALPDVLSHPDAMGPQFTKSVVSQMVALFPTSITHVGVGKLYGL